MQKEENTKSPDILILGYLKNELTDNETAELTNWLRLSSSNKRYFDEYFEIWITSKSSLKNPEYNFHEGFWKFKQRIKGPETQSDKSDKYRLIKAIMKYAAIIILAFSLGGLIFHNKETKPAEQGGLSFSELIVPFGSRVLFTLPDGTEVTLNAGSRLKYDNIFGITDRVVNLEGEGYFKVAKDSERPFTVKTSHISVVALGTEFNVRAYSENKTIETTLVEGSLKIENIADDTGEEVIVLKPNQKVTYIKESSTIVNETNKSKSDLDNKSAPEPVQKTLITPELVAEDVNIEPIISWKENKWIFEQKCLSQIAIELERKFDVKIVFESERLKTVRFTGTILAEPIEQVLEVMSLSAPISYKLRGRVVTLSEKKGHDNLNKRLYNQ
jgi:ferric-dicitrate binding protein FerR (iron transport regulator)